MFNSSLEIIIDCFSILVFTLNQYLFCSNTFYKIGAETINFLFICISLHFFVNANSHISDVMRRLLKQINQIFLVCEVCVKHLAHAMLAITMTVLSEQSHQIINQLICVTISAPTGFQICLIHFCLSSLIVQTGNFLSYIFKGFIWHTINDRLCIFTISI